VAIQTPLPPLLAAGSSREDCVGTAFALMANSRYDDSLEFCDADDANACDQPGIDLRDDARGKGNIATVGFIAGGALLATAGAVWIFSGSSSEKPGTASRQLRAAPAILPGHAALYIQGSF
jgi:hypothetical protein